MDSLASNDFYLLGLILLCPAVGALINGVFGRFLPRKAITTIACTAIGLSFVFALISASAFFKTSRAVHPTASVEAAPEQVEGEAAVEGAAQHEEGSSEVLYASPTLEWTAFEWINSGDWAEGEFGYVPTTQFHAYESRLFELCVGQGGDRPAWATESVWKLGPCLSGVYTPNIREAVAEGVAPVAGDQADEAHGNVQAQHGIGGVRARLQSSSHRFGGVKIAMNFVVDALSGLLILIITGVGFLIHIYSTGYMRHDKTPSRYFAYLNLFCFAMLILVMGGNMIVTFVGWEGVGLCSYLLIGYYYESHDNADAGKKAFIVNRIGDFAFVIGMLTLFFAFGTFDYSELQAAMAGGVSPEMHGLLTLAAILIFIGCTGKSAQIPLFTWLPDAMAGPTPVSALIHAATMVTAGVYLISRLHFVYIEAPLAMMVVAIIGGLTAIFAASIAMVQNDIKKVLAYSTVSQLGYMFLAVGVGAFWVGVFHLMTHAFFKALLFLGSGSVIDAMHHEQDIRKMGGLRKHMPVTAITFLIGCMAIAGVPLLSGFFSKDQILWFAWFNQFPVAGSFLGWSLWLMGTITAGMTAFYMFRLYFLTFEGKSRVDAELEGNITESPVSMTVPLTVLAVLSVIAGYLGMPHFINFFGDGAETLPKFLTPLISSALPHREMSHSTEVYWEWGLMLTSVLVAAGGIFTAWRLYLKADPEVSEGIAERYSGIHKILLNKYYIDEIYSATVVRGTMAAGTFSHKVIDVVLIDFLLVRGAAWLYELAGRLLRFFQNGDLQRYAAYIVMGIVTVLYLVLL